MSTKVWKCSLAVVSLILAGMLVTTSVSGASSTSINDGREFGYRIAPLPQAAGCSRGCRVPPSSCVVIRTGEKIDHVPGQRYYREIVITPSNGERWFCTERRHGQTAGAEASCNCSTVISGQIAANLDSGGTPSITAEQYLGVSHGEQSSP
jgi:hypothetical protein